MNKYFTILFTVALCFSLVGVAFIPATPVSAQTGGTISGHVESEGVNISNANVNVFLYETLSGPKQLYGWDTTDANGEYTINDLPEGDYAVRVQVPGTNYVSEWNGDTYFRDEVIPVTVTTGVTLDIDFNLEVGGTISGHVGSGADNIGDAEISVIVYDSISEGRQTLKHGGANTLTDGTYITPAVPAGEYAVQVEPNGTNYIGEYYQDTYYRNEATRVSVTVSQDTSNINFNLEIGGTISGNVTDSANQPISDIGVHARVFNTQILMTNSVKTDVNGEYTLVLPEGTYRVNAWIPEDLPYVSEDYDNTYFSDEAIPVSVTLYQDTPNINFSLEEGGTISGIVTDKANQPINNLRVNARTFDTDKFLAGDRTNAYGEYTLFLPEGIYNVRSDAAVTVKQYIDEYYDNTYFRDEATPVPVTVSQDTPNINLNLDFGGTISGNVTDSANQPISGIGVHARDFDSHKLIDNHVKTDVNGEYTLILPGGTYSVNTWIPDGLQYSREYYDNVYFSDEATSVPVTLYQDTPNINFSLEEGGTISGTVIDGDTYQPIANLRLKATDYQSDRFMSKTDTDASGNYTLLVPAGSYVVSTEASHTGLNYGDKYYNNEYIKNNADPVLVTASDATIGIDFSLEAGGAISGIVQTVGGTPIPNLKVIAIDFDTNIYMTSTETDDNGEYTLVLPSGSYFVRTNNSVSGLNYVDKFSIDKYGYSNKDSVPVTAPYTTSDIDFNLELGGTISGIVTDNITGLGVSNIKVEVILYESVTGEHQHYGWAHTDTNGYYVSSLLPTEQYAVRVQPENTSYIMEYYQDTYSQNEADPVPVTALENTAGIDFSLETSGAISGIVQTETGTPINGVRIVAFFKEAGGAGSTLSGEDGSYRIEGLAFGDYHLRVTAPNYIRQWYDGKDFRVNRGLLTVATSEVTGINFSLKPNAGSLSGYVYEADGVTPIDYRAFVEMYTYNGTAWMLAYRTPLQVDGSYSLPSLMPDDDYVIKAIKDGYVTEWYLESSTETDATLVPITALVETSGINFSLSQQYETPVGDNVTVDDTYNGVTMKFTNVSESFDTSINVLTENPHGDITGFRFLGKWYDINTSNTSYSGPITMTMSYAGIDVKNENKLKLFHWNGTNWDPIDPVIIDTVIKTITGVVNSLSSFTIAEQNDLPIAEATVSPYLAQIDAEFTFDGGNSTDPDGIIVSYEWDFNDGNGSGVLETPSVMHSYAAPGIYNVILTVTDDLGAQSTSTVMVVVYDPDAGFATGGGWFIPGKQGNSDPGDILPSLDGSSKATFGFVVKYKNGATTTPSGQLEFRYRVGDFNLHSSDYDWLVVTNNNWAKFQGLATINGSEGLYPFRVDARDTDKPQSDGDEPQPDRFIIKIWAPDADPDVDELIYKASGDLGGGNIVIHK